MTPDGAVELDQRKSCGEALGKAITLQIMRPESPIRPITRWGVSIVGGPKRII